MKRMVFAAALFASPAVAAEPPGFVPFTIEQSDFETLSRYLNGQPLGMAEPLMNWLRQKEADAQEAKRKAAEPKKDAPKND